MAGKEFISIKKAAQLTGQPEPILLKLWEKYQLTSKVKEKNGKRYISQALLKKKRWASATQPENTRENSAAQKPTDTPDASASLMELLTRQLQEKDKQLTARDTQIAQLIERTREQNNIIFSLEQHQQQLESKLALQIPASGSSGEKSEKPQINYVFIALVMLLVGIVLIIFYTFMNS